MREESLRKIQLGVVLSLCFLSYGDSIKGEFVFDDRVAVVQNTDVTSATVSFSEIFQHDFWGQNLTHPNSHKSYRPFTILAYRFEKFLFGKLNPTWMKGINVVLHSVVCVLLMDIVALLFTRRKTDILSLSTTILFAVHPIHTEAVCGIVGQADLFAGLIFCYGVKYYLESFNGLKDSLRYFLWKKYLVLYILTITGVLFKETAITVLPTCAVLDGITSMSRRIKNWKRQLLARILPLIIGTSVILILRLAVIGFKEPKFTILDNPVPEANRFFVRVLSQNYLYAMNLWLLICPDWLSFDWALGSIPLVESIYDYRFIFLVLFYISVIITLFNVNSQILTASALLVVPFLPASGIIKVGFVVAERILYIPSIGFCLLVALGFTNLVKLHRIIKVIAYGMYLFLVVSLILKTRQRAFEWTKEIILYESALHVCPGNAKVYYNIARLASDSGELKKSKLFYHKAIELYPEYEAACMNLGNVYRSVGNLKEAEKYLNKALELDGEFPAAWLNLGILQMEKEEYTNALESFKTALKYRKRFPNCYYNLGNLYMKLKNYKLAMASWKVAIELQPDHSKAWLNILNLLDELNRNDDVIKLSEDGIKYLGHDPAIYFARGNAFGKLKEYIEAEKAFNVAIKLRPLSALYHSNLGVLYHRWKKIPEAISCYKRALRLDPSMTNAKIGLNQLTITQKL